MKSLRADARRNRERLLAVAADAFERNGVDASLEDMAKAAGVGIGTLYRHFPTRGDLLEALLGDRFDGLAALAGELAEVESGEALRRWLLELAAVSTLYRGLIEAVSAAMSDEASALYVSCAGMRSAGGRLMTRAREAGQLRAESTDAEVFLLVHGVSWASRHHQDGPESVPRLLDLVFSGLRPS